MDTLLIEELWRPQGCAVMQWAKLLQLMPLSVLFGPLPVITAVLFLVKTAGILPDMTLCGVTKHMQHVENLCGNTNGPRF